MIGGTEFNGQGGGIRAIQLINTVSGKVLATSVLNNIGTTGVAPVVRSVVQLNANDGIALQAYQTSGSMVTLFNGSGMQLALAQVRGSEIKCPTASPTF